MAPKKKAADAAKKAKKAFTNPGMTAIRSMQEQLGFKHPFAKPPRFAFPEDHMADSPTAAFFRHVYKVDLPRDLFGKETYRGIRENRLNPKVYDRLRLMALRLGLTWHWEQSKDRTFPRMPLPGRFTEYKRLERAARIAMSMKAMPREEVKYKEILKKKSYKPKNLDIILALQKYTDGRVHKAFEARATALHIGREKKAQRVAAIQKAIREELQQPQ
ncbi:MAG: hypothetical protein MHM6MM_001783 [Cercozoa sp. M6MM]